MTVQTEHRSLDDMRLEVFEVNFANGWFDDDRDFDDDIALNHSEVSEMFEAYRDWGFDDMTVGECKTFDHSHAQRPFQEHLCKPQGFGSECADVLIRLLDMVHRRGMPFIWDSLAEVDDYAEFDPTLTVGGHIRRLHMIISYVQPGTSLNSTLSYLVTWCRHVGIDLQAEFERKLAFNRTRGYKHGNKLI